MNRDDPLFQALRRLPPPTLDATFAQQVRRQALAELGVGPARMSFLARVLAPAALAVVAVGYFTWSVCFVLAG
jgi:hypothetical protein